MIAFIFAVAGCGSSSSSSSSPESNATGSIAAKLIWNSAGAKTTAKTLYAAPAVVANIQIIVSAADMLATVSDNFPAAAGTGTISGIPAGSGRIVKINGLDSGGILRYTAEVSGITIEAGVTTDVGPVIMAPVPSVTTANPPGGTFSAPQSVTLTASDPATIYYTTNGVIPTFESTNGPSPVTSILITSSSVLQFFSINSLGGQEAVRTAEFIITP